MLDSVNTEPAPTETSEVLGPKEAVGILLFCAASWFLVLSRLRGAHPRLQPPSALIKSTCDGAPVKHS